MSTLGAVVSIRITGGYGRVIKDPILYKLTHEIKNCIHRERWKFEMGLVEVKK